MKILVTGGCGYKGHVLIPKLLSQGHEVCAFDIQWFGNFLEPHKNLKVVKGDVRNVEEVPLDSSTDCIVHLASIANDPCGDLNPQLTWEVSALATMQLADRANRFGVKRFIYASSGSVYGIKDEDQVTEDLELKPISEYNKTKMVAERVLLSYKDEMVVQIVRPATVCGYSPRLMLDLAVNILTNLAFHKREIKIFGGNQLRPNIHINDIIQFSAIFLFEKHIVIINNENNKKIFLFEKILVSHEGSGSIDIKYKQKYDILRNWHYCWSKFNYYCKHDGYVVAFSKTFPNLIKSLKGMIISIIKFNYQNFDKHLAEFKGILSAYFRLSSYYRIN